jgi:hypothetical protein
MSRRGKNSLIVFLAMMMILGCASSSLAAESGLRGALQPYQDPGFVGIAQGPSQCGPTCFYMIFNFYRAQQKYQEIDLSGRPEKDAASGGRVTRDTAICQWINSGGFMGTSLTRMKKAADALHVPGEHLAYFQSELIKASTAHKSPHDEAIRERRLLDIKERYLDRNRPVIIHLRRSWYLPGHYLVLTGYDREKKQVYYTDPNGGMPGAIDKDSFIREKWYASPTNAAGHYRARWDGEWFGFYIRKP